VLWLAWCEIDPSTALIHLRAELASLKMTLSLSDDIFSLGASQLLAFALPALACGSGALF